MKSNQRSFKCCFVWKFILNILMKSIVIFTLIGAKKLPMVWFAVCFVFYLFGFMLTLKNVFLHDVLINLSNQNKIEEKLKIR